MVRSLFLGCVGLALVACANDLEPSQTRATPTNQPRDLQRVDGASAAATPADEVPADEVPADEVPADEVPANESAASEPEALPPGPPPALAGQSCQEWSDCGPNFANLNSGFDCAQGVCACNVNGNWDDACSQIGGIWSEEECFCIMGATPRPPFSASSYVADDEEPSDDDERICWWTWRESCEPDTWVDAGYEWVCNGPGNDDCGYEYDANGGYWESGDCSGYWLRRCDDGTQKRYGG